MAEILKAIDLDEDGGLFFVPVQIEVNTRRGVQVLEFCTDRWEGADFEYRERNPRPSPPFTRELQKDPAIYRALGASKPIVVRELMTGDPAHLLACERWEDARHYYVVGACLQADFRRGGQEVPLDATGKAEALKKLGLTTVAAAQVYRFLAQAGLVQEEEAAGNSEGDSGQTASAE